MSLKFIILGQDSGKEVMSEKLREAGLKQETMINPNGRLDKNQKTLSMKGDFYIADPKEVYELLNLMPDTPFVLIYISSGETQKDDGQADEYLKFESDLKSEVAFGENCPYTMRIEYTGESDVFDPYVREVLRLSHLFENILRIVRKMKSRGQMWTNSEGSLMTFKKADNDKKIEEALPRAEAVADGIYAANVLLDEVTIGRMMISYFSNPEVDL